MLLIAMEAAMATTAGEPLLRTSATAPASAVIDVSSIPFTSSAPPASVVVPASVALTVFLTVLPAPLPAPVNEKPPPPPPLEPFDAEPAIPSASTSMVATEAALTSIGPAAWATAAGPGRDWDERRHVVGHGVQPDAGGDRDLSAAALGAAARLEGDRAADRVGRDLAAVLGVNRDAAAVREGRLRAGELGVGGVVDRVHRDRAGADDLEPGARRAAVSGREAAAARDRDRVDRRVRGGQDMDARRRGQRRLDHERLHDVLDGVDRDGGAEGEPGAAVRLHDRNAAGVRGDRRRVLRGHVDGAVVRNDGGMVDLRGDRVLDRVERDTAGALQAPRGALIALRSALQHRGERDRERGDLGGRLG